MVKFLSVSGVNTETHPEINTHILNFPSQKDTPHTHTCLHTRAGRLTDVSALRATCSRKETHTHIHKACSASESPSSYLVDGFCSFCWRRSWGWPRDPESPSSPKT